MNISKDSSHEYFTTYDIGLASVLLTLDFILESLNKANPRKVQFIFQKPSDTSLDEAIQSYWDKTLRLEPQTLLTNLKLLKNRLYSEM